MSFTTTPSGYYDPNQALTNLVSAKRGPSVLFLFQPLARPFTDQLHRPLTYRLSDEVLTAAHVAAHRVENQGKSPRAAVESVLAAPYALDAMMPSFDPMARIGLSNLSNTWKFLFVTNGFQSTPEKMTPWAQGNAGRELYFGYFVDEPINPTTLHMAQPTLNHDAKMVITHKSVIHSTVAHTPQASIPRFHTLMDAAMLDPMTMTALSDRPLQVNDPLHLSQNTEMQSGGAGVHYAIPQPVAANDLSYQSVPIAIDASLQNPQENLRTLMNAAIAANSKVQTDRQFGRNTAFEDNYTHDDIISESMEGYFQSASAAANFGLRPDQAHTLGMLWQIYQPQVFPVASDRSVLFSPADQSRRHASTVFCALLSSAIPPLLMQAQILHLAFQYESRSYDRNQPQVWTIYSVQAAVPMPDEILHRKVQAVMQELEQGLFRGMVQQRGDFAVHGSFGVANVTHCYVNFHCDTERMVDPYEVPSVLGGLTTSLVADSNTTFQNSAQYAQLLQAMTGGEILEAPPETPTTTPGYAVNGEQARFDGTGHPSIPAGLFRF